MPQRITPVALECLKDGLSKIYWYKSELRSFIQNSVGDPAVLQVADWNGYKRQIVSDIVDHLAADQERYLGHLRRLIHDVCEFKTFNHLEQLEDGLQKAERAREAVVALKRLVEEHDATAREKEDIEKKRKEASERLNRSKAVLLKLEDVKRRYTALVLSTDASSRGLELEKIMYDIFEVFDLDPKASFKLKGEQIDGAFSLDGTDYLFEAKWKQETVSRAEMDAFAAKVGKKLENTLGLFLAINGFSRDGIDIHSAGRAQFILMTGADLMAVLEGRIDFVSLLRRKKRFAAQTGKIMLEIHEFERNA
jgi:Restriction endonuclease